MGETWVQSPGREDPLEKEMATHSSILAWRIPWTEDPGRLQSMGSQKVGHNWVTNINSLIDSEFSPWFTKLLKGQAWKKGMVFIQNHLARAFFLTLVCWPHVENSASFMGLAPVPTHCQGRKKNYIAQGNCDMYIADTHTEATEGQGRNRLTLLCMTKLTHEKGLNLVMPWRKSTQMWRRGTLWLKKKDEAKLWAKVQGKVWEFHDSNEWQEYGRVKGYKFQNSEICIWFCTQKGHLNFSKKKFDRIVLQIMRIIWPQDAEGRILNSLGSGVSRVWWK